MDTQKESLLAALFTRWAGSPPDEIEAIPLSGSNRRYFRLKLGEQSSIGVYSENRKENEAFITFTRHFFKKGLNVPEIYAEDLDAHIYLQEDLGDMSLLTFMQYNRPSEELTEVVAEKYRLTLEQLIRFQLEGGEGLDYSKCYPRSAFDQQSMIWDLNYFKYYFLKLAGIPFDEQELEEDFQSFSRYLLQTDHEYFLYRDFQARNVMLRDGIPYFIDYQGGRKGALQYDLASILYQGRANIPAETRVELLNFYLDKLAEKKSVDREEFTRFYYAYSLIRCIQVLGAYGYRGFFEQKSHFLRSIPFAVRNLADIMSRLEMPIEIPALKGALQAITEHKKLRLFGRQQVENPSLTVHVNSFSYKQGIPVDESEHGGGFIFDCRALHNPGRYEPYKELTGRDGAVIRFLRQHSKVESFLQNVYGLVDRSVENYLERKFTHLSVNFGCTGGQHRSVYCADQLSQHLRTKYGVPVILHHIEQEKIGRL